MLPKPSNDKRAALAQRMLQEHLREKTMWDQAWGAGTDLAASA